MLLLRQSNSPNSRLSLFDMCYNMHSFTPVNPNGDLDGKGSGFIYGKNVLAKISHNLVWNGNWVSSIMIEYFPSQVEEVLISHDFAKVIAAQYSLEIGYDRNHDFTYRIIGKFQGAKVVDLIYYETYVEDNTHVASIPLGIANYNPQMGTVVLPILIGSPTSFDFLCLDVGLNYVEAYPFSQISNSYIAHSDDSIGIVNGMQQQIVDEKLDTLQREVDTVTSAAASKYICR